MAEALQSQQHSNNFLVLDTSFFMRSKEDQFWTREPLEAIKKSQLNIVIPADVYAEYRALTNGRTDINGETPDSIETIFGVKTAEIYRNTLRDALSERLNRGQDAYGRGHNALTLADKKVVQVALDYARGGGRVYVASSDWAIISEVEGLSLEENVDMRHYSPWRLPARDEGIDMLVTGAVFGELPNIHAVSGSSPRYLVVAKNQDIGGNVCYDIAFGIYVNRDFALRFPVIYGAYYVKLYPIPLDFEQAKRRVGIKTIMGNFIDMVSRPVFGVYNEDNPAQAFLFRVDKPLNVLQRKRFLEASRKGQLKQNELSLISGQRVSIMDSARIEEDDISRHNKVTVGRIDEMLHKLNGRNVRH